MSRVGSVTVIGMGRGVVDVDTEFFEDFPMDGLVRQLARPDMSADEVPAVGIPPTRWDGDVAGARDRLSSVQRKGPHTGSGSCFFALATSARSWMDAKRAVDWYTSANT